MNHTPVIIENFVTHDECQHLINTYNDKFHHEALKKSTIAILDSGFFCILLFIFKRLIVKKFSGYLFLKKLNHNCLNLLLKISKNLLQ